MGAAYASSTGASGRPRPSPYDGDHRLRREKAIGVALNTLCPKCGELMLKGQDLDFDHSEPLAVNPNSKADQIVHAHCNRSEGGELGAAITNERARYRHSRDW